MYADAWWNPRPLPNGFADPQTQPAWTGVADHSLSICRIASFSKWCTVFVRFQTGLAFTFWPKCAHTVRFEERVRYVSCHKTFRDKASMSRPGVHVSGLPVQSELGARRLARDRRDPRRGGPCASYSQADTSSR